MGVLTEKWVCLHDVYANKAMREKIYLAWNEFLQQKGKKGEFDEAVYHKGLKEMAKTLEIEYDE